jgi:hypothetical protein
LPDRHRFHGWATSIEHTLGQDARSLVYRCLADLLMLRPPRGSIWVRAYTDAAGLGRRGRRRAQAHEEVEE